MKRVKAACICQVLHFQLKDGIDPIQAADLVQLEVAAYKSKLTATHTQFKILREELQPDGSVILEIIKQYNQNSVGSYLD